MRKRPERGMKLARLVCTADYRRGLRLGVGAAVEHERLMAALPLGSVIDVGANKGQFSLMLNALHPDTPIHAFEPLAEAADVFQQLFAAVPAVRLHQFAAGAQDGIAEIHLSGSLDSSSLLPISALQDRVFPGTAAVATRTIRVRPIDQVLADWVPVQPLLIKLDVQGYELEALRGMPALLDQAAYIYLELSFAPLYFGQPVASEIIGWLAERGFHLGCVNAVSRTAQGLPVQADVLFWRDTSPRPSFA